MPVQPLCAGILGFGDLCFHFEPQLGPKGLEALQSKDVEP